MFQATTFMVSLLISLPLSAQLVQRNTNHAVPSETLSQPPHSWETVYNGPMSLLILIQLHLCPCHCLSNLKKKKFLQFYFFYWQRRCVDARVPVWRSEDNMTPGILSPCHVGP